jgi:predicted DNA-binding transcriptional regulator YafY
VNRTDRLYALVEELRAVAPGARTARQLADRFEVSVRTVERDLSALQQAGIPIYATPGPGGGYAVDKSHTLPPVNFTPDEAAALAIALARPGASPFADALRSAVRKVVAAMPDDQAKAAQRLADRVHLFAHRTDDLPSAAARTIEEAMRGSGVVEMAYEDRNGKPSTRVVEPVAMVGSGENWYVVAYCRLREDHRSFRLDRIASARLTGEVAPERGEVQLDVGPHEVRRLSLLD